MGMAGGAFEGDKFRAQQYAQAAQNALRYKQMQLQYDLKRRELEQKEKARLEAEKAQRGRADRKWLGGGNQQMMQQNALMQQPMNQNNTQGYYSNADSILGKQKNLLDEYRQIADNAKQQRAQKIQMGQNAVGGAMKMAMLNNNSFVPREVLMKMNRDMGMDNNHGFVGGGFTSNGDFYLDYVQRDNNGQLQRNTNVIDKKDQYKIMNQLPGIFDDNDRKNAREYLSTIGHYSDKEIDMFGGVDVTNKAREEEKQALINYKNQQDYQKHLVDSQIKLDENQQKQMFNNIKLLGDYIKDDSNYINDSINNSSREQDRALYRKLILGNLGYTETNETATPRNEINQSAMNEINSIKKGQVIELHGKKYMKVVNENGEEGWRVVSEEEDNLRDMAEGEEPRESPPLPLPEE